MSSATYQLSEDERQLLRENDMADDIALEERRMNRRIQRRQNMWTTSSQRELDVRKISVLLFGMGGVGKSRVGSMLIGDQGIFASSNRATSETRDVQKETGWIDGTECEVFDTPGYLIRQVMEGEPVPDDIIKKGITKIGDGIHVFVIVLNASDLRNLDAEIRKLEQANILNARTAKHSIMVVTHSGAIYSSKNVNDFIADASVSNKFKELLTKINNRVVLVELGTGDTLNAEGLDNNPYYSGELKATRDMVFNMMRKTMHDNSNTGSLYNKSAIESDVNGCFPAEATVVTPYGESTMAKLQINDSVLVVDQNRHVKFEKIMMFSHANKDQVSYFCTLKTEDGKILRLTPGHCVHVENIGNILPAKDVLVGDKVFTYDAEGDGMVTSSRVESTGGEWMLGLYCPHTPSGSIVVNGLAASCYTNALSPALAHMALMPVRALHQCLPESWFEWLLPYNSDEGMPEVALKLKQLL